MPVLPIGGGGIGAQIGGTVGMAFGPEGALIGSVIGQTVEGLTRLAASIATLPVKIRGWDESLLESQRDLRRFNGAIARTFTALDRQRIMLDVQQARATGGTVQTLGRELMELKETLQPLREFSANITNLGGAISARFVSQWIQGVEAMLNNAAFKILNPKTAALFEILKAMHEEMKKMNVQQGNQFQAHFRQIVNRPINFKR